MGQRASIRVTNALEGALEKRTKDAGEGAGVKEI